MSSCMATDKRLRLSFDADEEATRRAVYIAAGAKGKTHSEILCGLIKTHLAPYVQLAKKELAREQGEEEDSGSSARRSKT